MNLEAIALRRAEEQMQSSSWRRADRFETIVSAPELCQVPGCWNPITPGRGKRNRCDSCSEHGWVATPCKACGGRIRRIDQKSVAKDRRGMCQVCRAGMPKPAGNQDLSAARAELARRRGEA